MRILVNLVIAAGLLLAFNFFEWLALNSDGRPIDLHHLTGPAVGNVLLVAVVLWLVGICMNWLYKVVGCLTLGVMFLAYPFIGWATLKLTAHFMPETLTLHGFWITVLCGFLLMIVKIHRKKLQAALTPTPVED
jgi:uncharacterized membrane protein YvlD (DUF360 family)